MTKKKTEPVAHFFGGTDPAGTGDDVNFSLDATDSEVDETEDTEELGSLEGEIAIDVYQTENDVVIVSPIAGVDPEDIEISVNEDEITISGERTAQHTSKGDGLLTQEIYWGAFSRTVALPVPSQVEKASAACKHGILTITIPKAHNAKKRTIKVQSTE